MITVLTPSFNGAKWIEDCIQSVKNAAIKVKVEHIIIDAGSTDNTHHICKNFPEVKLIVSPGCSISEALNIGIAQARGELLGWLNTDDMYLPNSLDVIWGNHKKLKKDWYIGNTIKFIFSENKYVPNPMISINSKSIATKPEQLRTPGGFYKKNIFQSLRFNEKLHYVMDLGLYLDLFERGLVPNMVEENVTIFRVHKNQVSGIYNLWPQTIEMTILLIKHNLYTSAARKLLKSLRIYIFTRIKQIFRE